MTAVNDDAISIDELRQYVLTHREDLDAFHAYIEPSKAAGRTISIDLSDFRWEESLVDRICQITSKLNRTQPASTAFNWQVTC
jgi:hypothetical protein